STSGTLWTSLNGGDTWTKRLGDLDAPRTRGSSAIAYHPTKADEIWTVGARKTLSGTLWRSIDHGVSWASMGGTPFVNERAVTIHILPAAPNEIWVGTAAIDGLSTAGGLWCSTDSGANWRKVWDNGGAVTTYYGRPQVSCIARNADRISLFSTNTGVWQVTATDWNNPATFTVSQATFANQAIPNVTVLADGTFWTTEIGDQTWAPKVSTNGSTWTDRQIAHSAAYVPEWTTAANITAKNRVYGRDMLVQDPKSPSRWLVTGGASAHLSEDNGLTWRYQPGGMAGIASYRANFDRLNPGRAYLASSDRGIFVLNDGGLTGRTVHCSNRTFNTLHTFHETMVSSDGQTIVAAGVHQGENRTVIIRSTDGGASWSRLTPVGLPDSYEGVTRSVMSLNDSNDFLVLLGYTSRTGDPNNPGLYRTTDGGANFVKVGGTSFDGIDTGMRYHPENAFLERDGINPNLRYMALRASNNSAARGVWRSTDGGSTWIQRVDPVGGQWIIAFAVDPTVEGRLWAASGSLRRSDDGGGSWVTVGNFTAVNSISAHAGRLAVLGRRSGDTFIKIYASPDNGASWQEMTNAENRMAWAQHVSVDPWRPGQIWVAGSRSFQLINPPTAPDPLLTGSATGSAPASGDTNFSAEKAFDANTATAFAPAATGGFTQLDLGAGRSARVTTLRYFPRAGFESRMNEGRFEGSPDGATWTTLASITLAPPAGWQALSVGDTGLYRFLRYIHPTGLADVAEIEFRGQMASPPTILNQPLPTLSGLVGQPLTYTLSASGYPTPIFTIASGALPAGLVLNQQTGIISGTPTAAGSGNVTIQATNSRGSATASLAVDVPFGPRISVSTPAPSFVQAPNTTGTAPVVLTNTGDAPLSWSAGVPTVEGSYALAASNTTGSGVSYGWIDAVTGGTKITFGSVDNSSAGPISLPFAFPFYGSDRNSVRVCTNGWLSFTSTLTSSTPSATLPGTGNPENLIAPFFCDLYLRADSGVYHRTVDAQTFVISYMDLVRYADRAATNPARYTFQVVLKVDGRILFQYANVPNLTTTTRVVGIQNAARTIGTAVAQPTTISDLTGRAYQLTPPLGWLAGISPANSSAAGGMLAGGASITLNAALNTAGLANGQVRAANITFTSNDPASPTRAVTFNLTVGTPPPPPVIAAGQSGTGMATLPFSYALQASNSPTKWAMVSGTLPAGVAFDTAIGVISGTPTASGVFNPVFTASNQSGTSPGQSFPLTINAPPPGNDYNFNVHRANFEETYNETAGWGALWSSNIGIAGSGGLATDSNSRAALLPGATVTFNSSGQFVDLSIAFKARVTTGSTNTAGGDALRIGLNRANAPLLTAGGFIAAGMNRTGTSVLTSALATESRNNVPGTTGTTDSDALTLTDSHWYALDATITYDGGNAFTVSGRLYNLGPDGTSAPVLVDSYTAPRSGLSSLVGVPLYAGFQGLSSGGFGGVRALDNFKARVGGGPPNGMVSFRSSYGLAADGSQDTAMPARDGVANLLKYAFNMIGSGVGQAGSISAPNVSVLSASGSAGLPRIVSDGTGRLTVTYLRRKPASNPGVSYGVEWADASFLWSTNPAATENVTSIDTIFERVTLNDSVLGSSRRFARVRVTTAP
ncbi:MAG TPA: putative Ig domain-containing protein, partial [Chthoniobacteraceae bacterium]